MIVYAVGVLVMAALGGAFMVAVYVLRGKRPPLVVAGVHGALGAIGLVLVTAAVLFGAGDLVRVSLVALVVAAVLGFYILVQHLLGARLTLPPVLVHAALAIFAVVALSASILGLR